MFWRWTAKVSAAINAMLVSHVPFTTTDDLFEARVAAGGPALSSEMVSIEFAIGRCVCFVQPSVSQCLSFAIVVRFVLGMVLYSALNIYMAVTSNTMVATALLIFNEIVQACV